jgi:hypothetical protein
VKNRFYILESISRTQGLTSSGNVSPLYDSGSFTTSYSIFYRFFAFNLSGDFSFLGGLTLVLMGGSSRPAFCSTSFISLAFTFSLTRKESWHTSISYLRRRKLTWRVIGLTMDWYIREINCSGIVVIPRFSMKNLSSSAVAKEKA